MLVLPFNLLSTMANAPSGFFSKVFWFTVLCVYLNSDEPAATFKISCA